MTTPYDKLSTLLKELFQTDQADLDFGIYKVINQKRNEINQFLDHDLLPQVKSAFDQYQSSEQLELQKELDDASQQAKSLGMDPNSVPKVHEIREQLAHYGSVSDLENEVYADLYNFFRRYYDKGDFISQRRYKEGVYAIPYEGEEVKLYWANHDQYYIKSSEYLRDYRFKMPSGKYAHFKLVEADSEKDNVKSAAENERSFVLAEKIFEWLGEELAICFEFRPLDKKTGQQKLNEITVAQIMGTRSSADAALKTVLTELATPAPTDSNPNRTLLEKHLQDYTKRNTSDYFIHKDLGGFLRRELDFFIKNEVMRLDDVENEDAARVEQYLNKIKVLRRVAHKIIDFLALIENFQKMLWLKKKFVVETNYCITLDRIPEMLYPEICDNDAQREEWVRLFGIDEIGNESQGQTGLFAGPAYTIPLTIEFLKANSSLVMDTHFFDCKFKFRLLESMDNLDEQIDGLLIYSENFQALNLITERFFEQVKTVYIDPPYNTGDDGFNYKDNFQYSSWLSMMLDRINLMTRNLSSEGIFLCSIDDYEISRLNLVLRQIWGPDSWVATFIRKRRTSSALSENYISQDHEYVTCYKKNDDVKAKGIPKEYSSYSNPDNDPKGDWTFGDLTVGMDKEMRPNQYYELISPFTSKKYTANPNRVWAYIPESMEIRIAEGKVIFPDDPKILSLGINISSPMTKRYKKDLKSDVNPLSTIIDTGKGKINKGNVIQLSAGLNTEATKELINIFGNNNFTYAKPTSLIHTLIDQFCPNTNDTILDFFAGSGTTGHAVINLNREDDGKRKYILVEMGQYFNSVTKPRIQKVIYSKDWKDGKPVSREGSSHVFKYIKLESYEDTLNNLQLVRNARQETTLQQGFEFREDYLLHYMLDVESKGSLLNLKWFVHPFDLKLNIASSSVGETTPTKVDLVETFNYLIGLKVKHISNIQGCVVVEGHTNSGERVLVIWRDLVEMDNTQLDEFFRKLNISTQDMEYDVIYVNGDNNLPNLRQEDENWKVRLIEEEFHRLMFAEG
jgi:adenine-specific DNA-methyltransferase